MLQHSYKLRGNDCQAILSTPSTLAWDRLPTHSKHTESLPPGYLNPTPYPIIPKLLSWHGMDGIMRSEIDIVDLMQPTTISQWT